jgi:hypothetical protein
MSKRINDTLLGNCEKKKTPVIIHGIEIGVIVEA